jgi:hypothetical protein
MKDLIDYTPHTLLAVCAIFLTWGMGYLIISDMDKSLEFKQQCIESGMQYINESCVK